MEPKKKLVNLAIFIAVGMFFGLLYYYLCIRYREAAYPIGDFLHIVRDRYMDFFNVNRMSAELDPYIGSGSSYPPFIHLISYLFSLLAPYATMDTFDVRFFSVPVYLGSFGFFSLILLAICLKETSKIQGLCFSKKFICTIVLLFSLPFIFLLDRGNYLIIAIIFYALFAFNYQEKPTFSAICLGIAGAIKIYPMFLILLYLTEKKWKPFFISLATCGVLSFIPLFFFKGGILPNIMSFIGNMFNFATSDGIVDRLQTLQVGITGLISVPFVDRVTGYSTPDLPLGLIFLVLAIFLIGVSVFFLLRKNTVLWEKMAFLTIVMILIMPNSFLYNLTFLLPVIVLFFLSKEQSSFDPLFILGWGLLLIPKAYFYWYINDASSLGLQMILDPLILMGLLVLLFLNHNAKAKNGTQRMLSRINGWGHRFNEISDRFFEKWNAMPKRNNNPMK